MSQEIESQKITPIIFEGKASEYFGIWIVNLLLSLVTFGVYSAWAKVRRKKYFYNNTLIDNVSFDYHANPIAILKGRIIAFIVFALYVYGKGSSPILAGVLVIVFFLALPWLIVRGSLFNARNTSHRGLRFDFVGTVSKAIRVFIGLPMLLFFTLGLIWPYIAHERSQFLMNNHRFGLTQFDMSRIVKQFYKVYLIFFIVPFIGILVAIAISAYKDYASKAKGVMPHAVLSIPYIQVFEAINTQMVFAVNDAPSELPKVERVYSDNAPADAATEAVAEGYSELTADNVIKAPSSMTAEEEKKMQEEEKALEEIMKKQIAESKMKLWFSSPFGILAGLGGLLLYGFFIFGFLGYFQSRIHNLVWNNTKLDKLSFKSSLRARDFMWLYLTNMLTIVCTFGLATPWAQIRLARYRVSKLSIVGNVDFDQFVGDKKAEVKATGEEVAEMFDVDLSFG